MKWNFKTLESLTCFKFESLIVRIVRKRIVRKRTKVARTRPKLALPAVLGAAVVPTPVTEAIRAPTWQEIVDTHAITRRIAEQAGSLMDSID